MPENYYQFEWGDVSSSCLIRFGTPPRGIAGGSGDNWYWTLGEQQYKWLRRSLEQSDAKLRFVFLHHLVGGSDRNQRGGAEAAPFWEWGGRRPRAKMSLISTAAVGANRFIRCWSIAASASSSTVTITCSSNKTSMASSISSFHSPGTLGQVREVRRSMDT